MTPGQEPPLAVKIYSEHDADLGALRGATIAVIGYGNQGHAHALNLRDSGLKVLVGQRPDGPGWRRAVGDDFAPLPIDQAVDQSDFAILALPDMAAPAVYREHIEPHLSAGQVLGFIHGFNIHYKQIQPRDDIDVIMVAPKGAGYMVRSAFQDGGGLPALVAVEQDASGKALRKALAWAAGIGAGRAGIIEATFAAETETDLFGEQVSVVGGVTALMKAAFEVLTEAGYEPEHAYFECVHEVKFVVDLIHSHGLSGMREH
ncbi:MAG: ketol-acid reductoisomerase, partial [Planctomycetes bacterium]|nr:ketol-acid reductoisomerase [Planctomycetota bacterium]